jgi:hypothetical protein
VNGHVVAFVVVLLVAIVAVVLIALAWVFVMRSLNEGDYETRTPLPEEAPVRAWSTEREREQEQHAAPNKALGDAKDRGVGRTWGG